MDNITLIESGGMTVKLRVLGLPQFLDISTPGLQFLNEILGRISFLNISNPARTRRKPNAILPDLLILTRGAVLVLLVINNLLGKRKLLHLLELLIVGRNLHPIEETTNSTKTFIMKTLCKELLGLNSVDDIA